MAPEDRTPPRIDLIYFNVCEVCGGVTPFPHSFLISVTKHRLLRVQPRRWAQLLAVNRQSDSRFTLADSDPFTKERAELEDMDSELRPKEEGGLAPRHGQCRRKQSFEKAKPDPPDHMHKLSTDVQMA